jgi:flagellar basal body-associated protein FliL
LISIGGGAVLTAHLVGKAIANLAVTGAVAEEEQDGEKSDYEIAEAIGRSAVVPLEPFVVNLADVEFARYLRIKVSFRSRLK